MKIVIPGGSGQVGQILARHFHANGHAVTVLTRTPQPGESSLGTASLPVPGPRSSNTVTSASTSPAAA